jgi:PAS domain S-box-containing protein
MGVSAKATVFIVDDDQGLMRLVSRTLEREGFITAGAESGEAAQAWLAVNRADLMLLDLKLHDIEGQALVDRLATARHCPPFIIITGQGDERVAVEMMKRGARDYLVKDADFLEFVPAVVKRALEQLDQERRLAEAEEQVHLVRSAIEQGFSAVLIMDASLPDPRVVYSNAAFETTTGYASQKILGQPLSALDRLSNVYQRLRHGLTDGAEFLEEVSTFQNSKGERWGEWRAGPVRDRSGRNSHWLLILRDITEHKRLEKEILEIGDQERRRIGQDLHDGLCQQLAGIELMSQVLEQKLARKSKMDAARAGEIARHVREAISQTRSLARGLTPVTLESEGLASALHELAANTERMFGVSCHVDCPRPVIVEAPAVSTHLYRIAQEAVSNAIKHGKAPEITIHLERSPKRILLRIADRGRGFPEPLPTTRGMGLRIMQYRSGIIGATLLLEKNPGGGATVVCRVSVAEEVPPGAVERTSEIDSGL